MTMFDAQLYKEDLRYAIGKSGAFLKGKRVFIAGATGLIGSFMVDALVDAGVCVYASGRSTERLKVRFGEAGGCLHFVEWDACRPLMFDENVDYIIHAACAAHPLAYAQDPVGTMQSNLNGTSELLRLAQKGGKLVFLSSGEVYGENPDLPNGFSETDYGYIDPLNPRACYPESKRASETLCAASVKQFGIQAVVARLCHVYGPTITQANSRADAQFLRKALSDEPIIMKSTGSQVRSFCYVADAVAALFTILEKGEAGQAYNIANRASVASIRDYAQTLSEIGHVPLEFDLPPETEKAGYSKITRAVLNSTKLEGLGWQAEYDLRKGLEHTYTICKSNGGD